MTRRRGGWGGGVLLLAFLVGLLLFDGRDREGRSPTGSTLSATVIRVVDGDTIVVDLDGAEETVRYIGVDTPETVKPGEPVQCFGPQASALNKRLVEDRTVRLVFDRERRDHYGRLLAYVHVDELFVNAKLVAAGAARTLEIEPNTARAERLADLEARAGREGKGLWGAC